MTSLCNNYEQKYLDLSYLVQKLLKENVEIRKEYKSKIEELEYENRKLKNLIFEMKHKKSDNL